MVSSIVVAERLQNAIVIAELNFFGYRLADPADQELRLQCSELKCRCEAYPDMIAQWAGSEI